MPINDNTAPSVPELSELQTPVGNENLLNKTPNRIQEQTNVNNNNISIVTVDEIDILISNSRLDHRKLRSNKIYKNK